MPRRSERAVQAAILLALGSRPDVRLWKQWHSGLLLTRDGRPTKVGTPGMADLSGIVADGRRLEVEVKSETGTMRDTQRSFGAMIERFRGIYIVARSVEDAIAQLEAKL